jgi:mono/diheme cytochrome c family protein
MRRIFLSAAPVLAVLALLSPSGYSSSPAPVTASPANGGKLSFNEHIQPILAENCFSCHGPDSSTRKAKLRLDRFQFATVERGDHEAAIIPGRPESSPLVERIVSQDADEIMPPPESHKTLKPAEIALLKRWIAEGAEYQEHWSLLAPTRPVVPTPTGIPANWARNPIDAFVATQLVAAGLQPAPTEDPARLLRRVTLDLTGLPPTPAAIAAFLRDPSPAAYDRAVDRLLTTDASAEHFSRQWLDAVRYADTHGIHIDNYRSIWPYRDWVTDAFKNNLPFDQFTIEQIAGDLLPNATLDQKVASGFNRCLPTTSEGGAIAAEYEAIYAKDRVETMSTVWLGLTTGCAACHDHKFDPITTKDFYALTAFFLSLIHI